MRIVVQSSTMSVRRKCIVVDGLSDWAPHSAGDQTGRVDGVAARYMDMSMRWRRIGIPISELSDQLAADVNGGTAFLMPRM